MLVQEYINYPGMVVTFRRAARGGCSYVIGEETEAAGAAFVYLGSYVRILAPRISFAHVLLNKLYFMIVSCLTRKILKLEHGVGDWACYRTANISVEVCYILYCRCL